MKNKILPLKLLTIDEIYNGLKATYEVPIYQRNFAWEKDEISALIQDVYDACFGNDNNENNYKNKRYYIGTLVTFDKGDQVYEVIDGQQRLTTLYLVLSALEIPIQNKLTYRARKKSNDTILSISNPLFEIDVKDDGIVNGFKYTKSAIKDIVPNADQEKFENFKTYFLKNVHLIHYQVPKDIDLNHYFEIMNSRGEQLEKHEIIKAQLIEELNDGEKAKFHCLWESCSEMNVYIQQKYPETDIFGKQFCDFIKLNFDDLPVANVNTGTSTISELIKNNEGADKPQEEKDKIDTFQPIMDFSNFLLIVLKLTRIEDCDFKPTSLNLDDKELINEFAEVTVDRQFVKRFGYNLLKAKFLLDNYLVHHSNEDDTIENNPWKLQRWQKDDEGKRYLKNLGDENDNEQQKLVQLLSMFEVTFTARQRKNYLFYCLLYLFRNKDWGVSSYSNFVSGLADKYFKDVYLVKEKLNENNMPLPGSFDEAVLCGNQLNTTPRDECINFPAIYGDGITKSKGIPLFVFNYLDYRLWEKYADELRGEKTKESSEERKEFFNTLGCGDFGLDVFNQFYFSRTRRSLEHFYPQANVNRVNGAPNVAQINCLGNYAMIGSKANSSGSNWSPKTKLDHYLDASGKIKLVSVASIKFMIMMQMCKDNHNQNIRLAGQEWNFDDIKVHQEKMLEILLGGSKQNLGRD